MRAGTTVSPAVLLASESPDRRRAWRQHLRSFERIDEVSTPTALDRTLGTFKPDVLLLDQDMLGTRATSQLPTLVGRHPSTRVLLLAGSHTARQQVAALRMGVRGCCDATAPASLLIKAVLSVAQGEIWVARNVVPDLLKEVTALMEMQARTAQSLSDQRFAKLTRSERLIAHLISGGASNKEIAGELNVTEKTVKAHLTAIFRKLGVTDRLRLALLMTERRRIAIDPDVPVDTLRSATG
jgi:DNA-binding NarL/FixJ family response regulator